MRKWETCANTKREIFFQVGRFRRRISPSSLALGTTWGCPTTLPPLFLFPIVDILKNMPPKPWVLVHFDHFWEFGGRTWLKKTTKKRLASRGEMAIFVLETEMGWWNSKYWKGDMGESTISPPPNWPMARNFQGHNGSIMGCQLGGGLWYWNFEYLKMMNGIEKIRNFVWVSKDDFL